MNIQKHIQTLVPAGETETNEATGTPGSLVPRYAAPASGEPGDSRVVEAEIVPAETPGNSGAPDDTGTNGIPDDTGTGTDPNPASRGYAYKYKTYASIRRDAYGVLQTAREDDDYVTRMAVFGYLPEKVNECDALYTDSENLKLAHEKLDAQKRVATIRFHTLLDDIDESFDDVRSFCRVLFKNDPEVRENLRYDAVEQRRLADKLEQRLTFYKKLLQIPGALESLAQHGVTLERLQAEQQTVMEACDLYAERRRLIGETQQTFQAFKAKFKALRRWVRDYKDVAKVAFRDEPRELKKVGVYLQIE
ncbi:MAG: hypothetical protein GY765_41620 [bacterium]|nr:hypothetical protein [bacterium]